jgi:hypothetical protein
MFLYDWFVGGFRVVGGKTVNILESLDRTWAFSITFKNIFKPLYQDQSFLGRILGIFFRFWRLVIAGVLYAVIIIAAACIYVAWAAILPYVVYKGFIASNI